MSIEKLTAENAIIKTASVEVKTLTISGKQVTLAVFRQLPERQLINPDSLKLNGIPWGTVNYHPDKCGDEGDHIHIVWQDGARLQRSTVSREVRHSPKDGEFRREIRRHENNTSLLLALQHLVSFLTREAPLFELKMESNRDGFTGSGGGWQSVTFERAMLEALNMSDIWHALRALYEFTSNPDRSNFTGYYGENGAYISETTREAMHQYLCQTIQKLLDTVELSSFFQEYLPGVMASVSTKALIEVTRAAWEAGEKAAQDRKQWLAAYSIAYQQLASLDQLYIAV